MATTLASIGATKKHILTHFLTSISIIINQHQMVYQNNSKTTKSYEVFQTTRTFFMIHVAKPDWLRKIINL